MPFNPIQCIITIAFSMLTLACKQKHTNLSNFSIQSATVYESLLEGVWQSKTDEMFTVAFMDGVRSEFYSEEFMSSEKYMVKKDTLLLFAPGVDSLYYQIIQLDTAQMTLLETESGQTFTFGRVPGSY